MQEGHVAWNSTRWIAVAEYQVLDTPCSSYSTDGSVWDILRSASQVTVVKQILGMQATTSGWMLFTWIPGSDSSHRACGRHCWAFLLLLIPILSQKGVFGKRDPLVGGSLICALSFEVIYLCIRSSRYLSGTCSVPNTEIKKQSPSCHRACLTGKMW